MRRTTLQYLDDILEAADRIERYTKNTSFEDFSSDTMRSDAVIRNFEVIGEAVKNIPPRSQEKIPEYRLAEDCRFPGYSFPCLFRGQADNPLGYDLESSPCPEI